PPPPEDGTPPPPAKCKPLPPGPGAPTLPKPEACPIKCDCPSPPPPTDTCFDDLIAQQALELNKADHAKNFKAELEDLLKKANAAKQAYSRDKYDDFKKRWVK